MTAFTWFVLILLASRVLLILWDAPQSERLALGLSLAQCAALLTAEPSLSLLPLLVAILLANLSGALLERTMLALEQPERIGPIRLGTLAIILFVAGFSFAPAHDVGPSPMLIAVGDWLGDHYLFATGLASASTATTPSNAVLVLVGALLVMNEANLLIRLILQFIRVVPHKPVADDTQDKDGEAPDAPKLILPADASAPAQQLDQREYNAGRFIGVLERLLVYAFVLQGQYAAIGLILAAKSFARFKEMDERDFAEYVLIGTLLSVGSAVMVGEAVKALLH